MKESHRMKCKVVDRSSPLGLTRGIMERIIQEHIDEGWILCSHSTIPYDDGGVRTFFVFVRGEKKS